MSDEKSKDEDTIICLHCGIKVPDYRKHLRKGREFCCNGCACVYSFIKDNKLDYYYTLQKQSESGGIPAVEAESPADLAWFDSTEFQDYHVHTYEENGEVLGRIELFLEGVHCPACVWLLEKSPEIISGLYKVRVDLSKSVAEIVFIKNKTSLSLIASEFTRIGYRPHPFRGHQFSRLRKKIENNLLLSLGIAGACAGNIMILSVCLYAGFFSDIDAQYQNLFRWTSFVLCIPSVFWSGRVFYRRAFAALSLKQVHLDVPISLGIISAFIGSAINTFRGAGEIYFDSVATIIFLLLVSRFLQFRAQHKSQEKTELLFSLLPSHVHLLEDEKVREASLDEVRKGSMIEVLSGEVIPVDGVIRSGESLLDCSVLTGESVPIQTSVEGLVYAGMKNISSPLRIEVTSTGEQTRIGRLARLASDMQKSRPAVLHLVDRLSRWFVMIVLLLAVVAFFCGLQHGLEEAFERLIALLIISCPCALGMATPLALSVALGNAARSGIHLRSTTVIELISKCRRCIFDKTGTLTEGKFNIHSIWGDRSVLPFLYELEKYSSHIVARSIVENLKNYASHSLMVRDVTETAGMGISAYVDDLFILAGNQLMMKTSEISIPQEAGEEVLRISESGCSPVYVSVNGELKLVLGLGDPIREGMKEVMAELQKSNEIYILSGDVIDVVRKVASTLDIPQPRVFGSMSPEDKVVKIKELNDQNVSIFFGDGSNDAAALASASVGIAMHGGAEASFVVSDGFFSRPDVRLLDKLFHGSRESMKVVYRGLASSFIFNIFGCVLAIGGYVSPLVAALLMPISSLIVVGLAFSQKSYIR